MHQDRAGIEALNRELSANLKGEVAFDPGSRALYATDASNYRQVPIGVVWPRDKEDVIRAVQICRIYGAPILPRGSGTSLAGQCCNVAVIFDLSRHMNRILEMDPAGQTARVEPGVILDDLNRAAQPHGLRFGPDPATHSRCTLGGMIGNNACGVHSLGSGKTADNVEALEILTYDGLRMRVGKTSDDELKEILAQGGARARIYAGLQALRDQYAGLIRTRYPKIPRRVSGYNLEELLPENGFHAARALVGTEGTCVMILEATLKLVPEPASRTLVVLGYPDVASAGDHVAEILGYKPAGMEGLDEFFIRNMAKKNLHIPEIGLFPGDALHDAKSWLLVEFTGASREEAEGRAREMTRALEKKTAAPVMKIFGSPEDQKKIWSVRESSFGASVFIPGQKDTYAGFEDSAVAPEKLGPYLRDLRALFARYQYEGVIYGHFGEGCLHARISFDLQSKSGIRKYRSFMEEASDLVVRYGGSFSGEHGDGQTWWEFLPKMFGPELIEAFREFKALWDPQGLMNPGKVVDAYKLDENLRLQNYKTIEPVRPYFGFEEDGGSFTRTTQRCIGIAKCLNKDSGTMCPSYRATGEEKHSPRGRAHLLFEMMRGEVITGGWQDEYVKEALDLCLSCKACKSECPVNVDVSLYKAEFLAHYYRGRKRPASAYAFGLIPWWADMAANVPALANFFTQTPGLRGIAKKWAGIAPERNIPRFAHETLRSWFKRTREHKRSRDKARPRVLLWPDTFSNYFYPETGIAAFEVLEALGYEVRLPLYGGLCCGRPLYDYGMIGLARQFLQNVMETLRLDLRRGMNIVVMEPSCLSVFREELPKLFPKDEDARCLREQSFLFAEFLDKKAPGAALPKLDKKAMVQGHCQEKAVVGMDAQARILARMGIAGEILDAGCCGMAGAFGFQKDHYELSCAMGEKTLLPRVRQAEAGTLIIADGFSCREQIRQSASAKPVHLAQVLQEALFQTYPGTPVPDAFRL